MRAEFYAYVKRNGAVQITRRRGTQRGTEVMVRVGMVIPDAAWQPRGVPSAEVTVPIEVVRGPTVEVFAEAFDDPRPAEVQRR